MPTIPKDTLTHCVNTKVMCLVPDAEVLHPTSKDKKETLHVKHKPVHGEPLRDDIHELAGISWNYRVLLHKCLGLWSRGSHRRNI